MSNSIDTAINTYISFMKSHAVIGNSELQPTHTLMGPLAAGRADFKGKFHIDGLDYEKFMKIYKDIVGNIDTYIVERPKEVGPLVIDIDFHTDGKHKERQYLDSDVEYIVKKFHRKIRRYLDVDFFNIKAFVLEKPEPSYEAKKNSYKDGFHIMYPDISMDVNMRYFLFDEVKREVVAEDGFKDINFTNTYNDIFDSSVIINNGMIMFGSHKENRPPYQLTKVYNHDMSIDLLDNYDDYDLISILSLRRHDDDDAASLNDAHNTKEMQKKIEAVASSYATGSKKTEKKKEYEKNKNTKINEIMADLEKDTKPINNNDIESAKRLLKLLSPSRSETYTEWIHVGWALHNISKTLLKDFIQFSKQSKSKYEPGCCEKVWEEADDVGYTISSLDWWARTDNPKGYLEMMREKNRKLVREAESGTHNDIANLVHEMHRYTYKCVSILKNAWFEFQDNKWVVVEDGYTLAERIATDISKEFCALNAYYLAEAAAREDVDRDELHKKSHKMTKTYEKIRNTSFGREVLKACARKFYDSKFEGLLDAKPFLIGFENGVFDLKEGHFRKGMPDDMVSMTTEYDYKEYDEDSPEILEIKKYFEQVQQEEEMREYILRLISSFMDGYVKDQKFVLWTGSGCHKADTLIKMHDGTSKKIQNIKLRDKVLGDDGRHRKVVALYKGQTKLHDVILNDDAKTLFTVNNNHRLAVRSSFKPCVQTIYDDIYDKTIYIVKYHYYQELAPTLGEEQFLNMEDANQFLASLALNPKVIQYDEIIPMSIKTWYDLKKYELGYSEPILCYYKMFMPNKSSEFDVSFTVQENDNESDTFFGIELDGNKRYVMQNGYVTYNSNGKSTTIDLIHNTLGKYSGVLPVTVLTRKRGGSGNANPELADKKGKRFLVIQEPEHDDTVYVGQMKELVAGNDTIYARALYGNPFTYKPQFKIVLICNKLPHIPSNDGGTWRRLRVTPWESLFVDKPKAKNEFKKDGELTEKMKTWAAPFAWILLNEYYPKYLSEGLCEPPKVTKYTDQYKKDSDFYYEFLSECLEETGDEDDVEKIGFLYDLFKKWYSANYGAKAPPKKELVSYIIGKKTYTIVNDTITGVRTKHLDQNDD